MADVITGRLEWSSEALEGLNDDLDGSSSSSEDDQKSQQNGKDDGDTEISYQPMQPMLCKPSFSSDKVKKVSAVNLDVYSLAVRNLVVPLF
jgi:hypothetical protein